MTDISHNPSDVSTEKSTGEVLTGEDMRERLRAACHNEGGQNAFARAYGFSAPNINAMIKGRRGIPASVRNILDVRKILDFALDNRQ